CILGLKLAFDDQPKVNNMTRNLLQVQIIYDQVNLATRQTIDQSTSGKLRDKNAKESWALIEDLSLYDNEGWCDPRDFAKLVKAISLPQDVPHTSDHCLIELENHVQRLMEAHLAPKSSIQEEDLATASAVKDCKKSKIVVGEGVTRLIFGVKEINQGEEEVPYWTTLGKRESYEPQTSTDGIVFRKMVEFLGALPINLKGNVGVKRVDKEENRLE
ncbi:hypothetical protein Tco_0658184, partial [Tanacetum coccineum]